MEGVFHGGYSTGPKTKDGIDKLITSKLSTEGLQKEKRDEAKRKAKINYKIKTEILEIEQWFITEGYLKKDWQKNFN